MTTIASALDVLLVSLTRDGRIVNPAALDRFERVLAGEVSDCFVFCHGWLSEEGEARREAARFFAVLEGALHPLGERVVPLRVALHWPSKPFGDAARASDTPAGVLWPTLERQVRSRARGASADLAQHLVELCEAEVPLAPEEERELELLLRRVREGAGDRSLLSPFEALSFWVMKRRAGAVGERLGREYLGPIWDALPCGRPRLHLVGHSFGAKLITSAVLGGVRPHSLTLLLGAFSAFAFAPEVPGFDERPGVYYRVLADQEVRGPIVVLRSDHDRALGVLYPGMSGSAEVGRGGGGGVTPADRRIGYGRLGYVPTVVATSALGAVGARGVGAAEVDLVETQLIGLPRHPIINVDGSRLLKATHPLVGAHRDIHHPEIATLILLAARLLEGSAEGVRPRRLTVFDRS